MRSPWKPITGYRRALYTSLACVAVVGGLLAPKAPAVTRRVRPVLGRVSDVSRGCPGQNAEVEEAAAATRYVYELWIGCHGIGFARSANGGRSFSAPVTLAGSAGFSWDPSVAVAPDGTVYAAYMHARGGYMYPVVAASFDHGAAFPQVVPLSPPVRGNWGDRDFIAVGRTGDIYVTWDYGPSAAAIKLLCSPTGSCAYTAGDVNAVVQKSTDGGRDWGPITPLGPGFPRNGGYGAPLLVQPSGTVDTLYWGHHVSKPPAYTLHPGHEYFTSSRDGTTWPTHPQELWPSLGSISLPTWWIDGDITRDAAGTLYVTWDTQTARGDTGWLTYSRDGGATWSPPVRVTPGHSSAPHIMEVVGGRPGVAYVAWQTDASPKGYATYLRPFSTGRGWLTPAIRVSAGYGTASVWPGDTFGIAILTGHSGTRLVLSWGSAIAPATTSEIYVRVVNLPTAFAATH